MWGKEFQNGGFYISLCFLQKAKETVLPSITIFMPLDFLLNEKKDVFPALLLKINASRRKK